MVEQVQSLGNLLDGVVRDVEEDVGEIPDVTRKAMADHFWCDLLAQLANVLDTSIKFIESIPERIADSVTKSRELENRRPVERFFLNSVIKHLLRRIQDLTVEGFLAKGKALLPGVRVLSVLMCKSPERHQAVVEYCIDPLGMQFLDATKKQLLEAFPSWLPNIQAEVGQVTDNDAPPRADAQPPRSA